MDITNIKSCLPHVVISCLLMFIHSCLSSQEHFYKHTALFIFGDSLYDPGNNNYINTTTNYQANFWPYGESYFNPPTGRFTNGRTIADFIAEFARLPLIPGYLDPSRGKNDFVYGANFASAGAGALVETNDGLVINLKTQLQYFDDLAKYFRQNLGIAKTDHLLSNAVYLFSCGGNDYDPNNVFIDLYSHEQYVEMVIGNLTDVFKRITENRGRKIGILNLPPLTCYPSIRAKQPNNTCKEELKIFFSLHNQQLYNKLQELETELDGFMYSILDFNTAVSNRMNNPSQYGFRVGNTACCGSGPFRGFYTCGGIRYGVKEYQLCDNVNDYFFFDAAHPNENACRQFAQMFWSGDSSVTTHYNLKTLFQSRNPDLLTSA